MPVNKSWGSNVEPKNFGRGAEKPQDWTCPFCNSVNKGRVKVKKANREVCQMCGVERGYAE